MNLKESRNFIGLANYYRKIIKDFSKTASPLHHLTRKGETFCWTESCENAFNILKQSLIPAPILAYPDFNKEFILFVDASATGTGMTLAQIQNEKEVVIARALEPYSCVRVTASLISFTLCSTLVSGRYIINQVLLR